MRHRDRNPAHARCWHVIRRQRLLAALMASMALALAQPVRGVQIDVLLNFTDDADDGTVLGDSTSNMAFGSNSVAVGQDMTAVGSGAKATGRIANIAIGVDSIVDSEYSIGIGTGATVHGMYATALGAGTTASGLRSVAIGHGSLAQDNYSIAIGSAALTYGYGSVALGTFASTGSNAARSVALGDGSYASEADTVSVGFTSQSPTPISPYYRRIVNVADGIADHDAATVGQLNAATGNVTALAVRMDTAEANITSLGGRITSAEGNIAALGVTMGAETAARVSADNQLQSNIDAEAATRAAADVALWTGINNEAVIRANADALLQGNLNTEAATRASADAALWAGIDQEAVIRANADAALQGSINANSAEIGLLSERTRGMSWTLGSVPIGASTTGIGSTALGSNASARTRDTAIGSNATITADGSVAVGADSSVQSADSVAAGADSWIGQDADGSVALGQNAQVATGARGSVALGQNSVADEPNTVSVGSVGNPRRLTNIAPGVNPSDAANVGQLTAMEGRLNGTLADIRKNAYSGIASVAAMSAVPDPVPGKNSSMGIGYGHYKGENALAIAYKSDLRPNVRLTVGLANAQGQTTTSAGLGWSW